uniref:tRNA (Guanine-N(7)-)-methyltransferase non-catalytic subunit wuho n=1 Tax=Diabrotica virgifera virgifera TaxID=50390 RepID=A0A6P7GVA3_DIAVI
MVLLKKTDADLYIANCNNIIQCNLNDNTDVQVSIPYDVKNVTSLEFSASQEYILISTENKQIIIYDKDFKVVKQFVVNRSPSKACFTPSNDIVVADKTGDVYLYKLQDQDSKPVMLLGHLSVVLDILISKCGKYIITSDRDEKIRVSHFPNCYNIVSYCLGHTEFVTKIDIIDNTLVSASGDGTIRFWDFMNGKQLALIDTNSYIEGDNLLQNFCDEMNKEKVEIVALPVTDMQLHLDKHLYIAVSIYKYDCIQLYSVDLSNFNLTLVTTLKVALPSTFCFENNLFVLSDRLSKYTLVDNSFVESIEPLFVELYQKYKSLVQFADSNAVAVLYKRKYDNVQEYLERKKQRL